MNKQLDILFVHGNGSPKLYQDLHKDFSARETPIWAAMLATSVKIKGYSTAVLDCEVLALSIKESVEKINEYNPRIVCFVIYGQNPNASTQNMFGNIETAKLLKQNYPQYKTLFIGAHVIALPDDVLNEKCVDLVCTGEGVYALQNLLKVTNLNDEYQLGKVKGIAWKDKEGLLNFNEYERLVPQELLEQDLPGIDWSLLPPPSMYRTSDWHGWTNNSEKTPFASLYTSLGCYATCEFCMINILNRTDPGKYITAADSNIMRHWSPNFIIKQFDYLAKQGVKNLKIADEMFVLRKDHYVELCKLLKERDYGFNIWCYSRINTVKEGYLDLMKEAGINWLALGIESADTNIRTEITKGFFKDESIVDVVKTIQSHDIAVGGNYIFGLTTDTKETIQTTIDFMMNNLTENMNVYPAMAYPGSPLYLQAKKNNIDLPKTYEEWAMFSYETKNLPTDKLSSAEILMLRDNAWLKYFTNPTYINWMKSKYGQKCVDSIKAMTSIKIKRKLLGD